MAATGRPETSSLPDQCVLAVSTASHTSIFHWKPNGRGFKRRGKKKNLTPQRATATGFSHEAILMSSCPAILPSPLGLIFKAGIINRLIIIPGKASIIIFCFFFNCGKITYNMKPFLSVQFK